MENDLLTKNYDEYISALMDLVIAQKKAQEFSALFPHNPIKKDSELTSRGVHAIHRMIKAYEIYNEKSRVWKNSLKFINM